MHIQRSLVALSLVLATSTAAASPPDREGAYVYGGFGKTEVSSKASKAAIAPGAYRKHSETRSSYTLGGGYRFSPHLAAEASFHDMSGGKTVAGKGAYDAQSVRIGGVGILPLGERIELFGKVAMGSHRQMFSPNADPAVKSVTERKWAVTPSLGANVYLTEKLALRAEYGLPTGVNKKVQQAAGSERMRSGEWSLGAAYRF